MGVTRFPNGVEVGDGSAAGTLSIGGTAITVTAAQINTAGGEGVDHPIAHVSADGKKSYYNAGTAITGAGTVSTGLTTCDSVVANLVGALPTPGSGTAYLVTSGTATAGGAVVRVYDNKGELATVAGTVTIQAFGT